MLNKIIKKELLLQLISAKFAVMLALILLLSILSTLVMVQDYKLRKDNYELLKPTFEDTYCMKPPAGMSVFVKGLDERMGRSVEVNSIGQLEVGTSQSAANRLFALFRSLDMHFIYMVILSLAALVFSFDLICGEKRSGTLKLCLANGISRNKVLLGKWLAAAGVVLISILLSLIVSLVMIQFLQPAIANGEFYLRVLVLILAIFMYLLVFISIGMFISSLTSRPSVSLVFALLVWAFLVFILPNTSNQLAASSLPSASVDDLNAQTRTVWFEEVFKRINTQDRGEVGDWTEMITGKNAQIYQEYINILKEKVDNLMFYDFISPASAYNTLAWNVSTTGPRELLRFKQAVVQYQQDSIGAALDFIRERQTNEDAEKECQISLIQVPRLKKSLIMIFSLLPRLCC
jgi:ABC-type transport system involved in multi-copper enzyme maturation permease subunit